MGAIEFVKTPLNKEANYNLCEKVFYRARKRGLETILSGHILRIAPPLNIKEAELKEGMKILSEVIKE